MKVFIVTIDSNEEIPAKAIQDYIWQHIDGETRITVIEVDSKDVKN